MAEERVQRRLAAILAADVVGYFRLMEADEAGRRTACRFFFRDHADHLQAGIGVDQRHFKDERMQVDALPPESPACTGFAGRLKSA